MVAHFKEGDLVIVMGSTRNKRETTKRHRVLANVIGVGKRDVFVRQEGMSSIFRISAERCIQVDDSNVSTSAEVIQPKIGDLILSVVNRYNKVERKMGVLMEIIDVPGRDKTARILEGETTDTVPLDSIVVVE